LLSGGRSLYEKPIPPPTRNGVSFFLARKPPIVKKDGNPSLGLIVLNPGGYYFLGGYFITIHK
jgi:hypothetical protein